MATQEELDKEREKARLLEEQNRLLERQLKAQSESISLSSSLVDSLKESMGIQSRRTQFDSDLLSLSKKINRTILDQQFATTKLSALEKQREKNQNLINTAKSLENSLSEKLTDNDKKRVENINNRSRALNRQLSQLDNILNLDKEAREAQAESEKELRKKIAANEAYVNTSIEGLSVSARQLLFTKQNREELEKTNAERENEIVSIQSIQNKIGLVGGAAAGLEKALSKIGFPNLGVSQAYEDTVKLGLEAQESGERFNAVGKFTSLLGNNLTGLISKANILTAAIGFLVEALASTDKSSGALAKNLGISYDESLAMVSSMTDVANLSMDTFVTTEGLVKAQQALSSALGTNIQLNSQLLVDFTKLTEQAGYSVEAATQLGILSQATGKPVEDITAQFLGQAKALNLINDLALSEKQSLESVAKISKGTLATFANKPKELSKAVFAAKQLGLELSQVEKIADGLLDIESSLAAEFEAEVITGRQLNLEKARLFALNNDLAGVAEELKNQGITQADFADSTRIEQQAIAKAMGLSADELGNMLIQQQALTNIGAKDAEAAKEKFENLKAQHGEAYAIANLGDEEYARQLQSQSVQDRFNKTVAKLKDIFVSIAEPVLAITSPFMDLVNTIMPAINVLITPLTNGLKEVSKYAKEIFAVFGSIYAVQKSLVITEAILAERQAARITGKTIELGLGQSILSVMGFQNAIAGYQLAKEEGMNTLRAIGVALEETKLGAIVAQGAGILKNIGRLAIENAARLVGMSTALATNAAVTFGIGVAIAVGAAAAGYAAIRALTGDDIMSPGEGSPGYGKRTLFGPEGAIALNNKDTVIAGTNLFPNTPPLPTTTIVNNNSNTPRNTNVNTTVTLSEQDIRAIANAVREGAMEGTSKANVQAVISRGTISQLSTRIQPELAVNTYKSAY